MIILQGSGRENLLWVPAMLFLGLGPGSMDVFRLEKFIRLRTNA